MRKERKIINTNIRLNLCDEQARKAWEVSKAEHRNAELLSKVSAHIMRHTACTRMAEKRMDVYNHVSEMSRIESEVTRLENVAIS